MREMTKITGEARKMKVYKYRGCLHAFYAFSEQITLNLRPIKAFWTHEELERAGGELQGVSPSAEWASENSGEIKFRRNSSTSRRV